MSAGTSTTWSKTADRCHRNYPRKVYDCLQVGRHQMDSLDQPESKINQELQRKDMPDASMAGAAWNQIQCIQTEPRPLGLFITPLWALRHHLVCTDWVDASEQYRLKNIWTARKSKFDEFTSTWLSWNLGQDYSLRCWVLCSFCATRGTLLRKKSDWMFWSAAHPQSQQLWTHTA